jgi:hypothetical protein
LRQAGVRYILSFARLPGGLTVPLGEARLPGLQTPLILHEVRAALPRAFWVPDCEAAGSIGAAWARVADPSFDPRLRVVLETPPPGRCGDRSGGASAVRWRRDGPHAVELEAEGDAGYVVFLEGYHPDWRVESPPGGGVALLRGNGRYWALSVPRGRVVVRVGFRPSWVWPAVSLASVAGALILFLLAAPRNLTHPPASR